ncbi:MAG: hypothetical protein GEV05_10795 [Betaproteobacteria bacterium]|nr:hypothetical protein [Betaproteobacteria bacterium]
MNKMVMAALAAAFASGLTQAQTVGQQHGLLADATERTLYTFTQDAPNKINCNAACAAAWPPFLTKEGERKRAGFEAIVRDDGTRQWALHGKPLYYFAADTQPGDAKGDGQGGVWHVVREGKASGTPAANSSSSSYGGY